MSAHATLTQALTVHCRDCRHQWTVWLPRPLPVDRTLTVIRGVVALGCPRCYAHGPAVLCGPTPPRQAVRA